VAHALHLDARVGPAIYCPATSSTRVLNPRLLSYMIERETLPRVYGGTRLSPWHPCLVHELHGILFLRWRTTSARPYALDVAEQLEALSHDVAERAEARELLRTSTRPTLNILLLLRASV